MAEIVGNDLQFIAGARLIHSDVQFVGLEDLVAFAQMPEGALGQDETWYFKKVGGQRAYFATESLVKAALEGLKRELLGQDEAHVVNPAAGDGLPVGPLVKNQEITFVTTGEVAGKVVTAGSMAVLLHDVEEGGTINWDDLAYVESVSSGDTIEATTTYAGTVKLINELRLNGKAHHNVVPTERAVANALLEEREVQKVLVDALAQQVVNALADQAVKLAGLGVRVDAVEGGRAVDYQEVVMLGDGQSSSFRVALSKVFIDLPILIWEFRFENGWKRTLPQMGDVVLDGGVSYLEATFAGVLPENCFRVTVKGKVAR